MYRERCRPKYSEEVLKEIYSKHWEMQFDWEDHVLRQQYTLDLANELITPEDTIGADLSCGDAYLSRNLPQIQWLLGDFAPGYQYRGPIEETVDEIPKVDVFLCCETLEHLDDPDGVLRAIRKKTKKLIISTPICRWHDQNPQHYWAWDQKAVRQMFMNAGFKKAAYKETPHLKRGDQYFGYSFQIWGCI